MDEIQQDVKPLSDDQDLAKALAGISDVEASADMDFAGLPPAMANINAQIAATEDSEDAGQPVNVTVAVDAPTEVEDNEISIEPEIVAEPEEPALPDLTEFATPEIEMPDTITTVDNNTTPSVSQDDDSLDPIKNQALEELRPLIEKLNIPAEEKFETYLLLIRSSDDKSLIAPAHQTALLIEDETKRAEALLDIIKEIEYLSSAKN